MRIILLLLVVVVISILWPSDLSIGACPEDTVDSGICDTLYVEVFPPDTLFVGPGQLVRVPIYVTHDIPNSEIDSIPGFTIPLCYAHTNETKYCSLSRYWNNTTFSGSSLPRSIFRHLVAGTDTIHNWFMDIYDLVPENVWAHPDIYLWWPSSCCLNLISTTQPLFGEGSRVLLATITFRVEDTMTICLDSCIWAPSLRLAFSRSDAVSYIPRHNLPFCFSFSCPKRGDFNADCIIDLGDVVYLTNYLYRGGSPPNPLESGDTNCDGVVELGDRVKLGNYVYRGGSPPCSP